MCVCFRSIHMKSSNDVVILLHNSFFYVLYQYFLSHTDRAAKKWIQTTKICDMKNKSEMDFKMKRVTHAVVKILSHPAWGLLFDLKSDFTEVQSYTYCIVPRSHLGQPLTALHFRVERRLLEATSTVQILDTFHLPQTETNRKIDPWDNFRFPITNSGFN